MKKKILSLVLAALFVIPSMLTTAVSAADFDHNKYWPLLSAYTAALETDTVEDDITACRAILNFYSGLVDDTSCRRVVTPGLRLAAIYEEKGMFADAKWCYTLLRQAVGLIRENSGEDMGIVYLDAILDHYSFIEPVVYAAANDPADVPYYGAICEPEVGTYTGMCDVYDPSISNGTMVYVEFGSEMMGSFSYKLPKDAEGYMLQIAWNIPDNALGIDIFRDIADGKYDAYIIENLSWLGTLTNANVMIRFAAEMNNWAINSTYAENGMLEEFKAEYIAAFRRISDLRKTYAPKAAMIYSPNDITNLYVTVGDFYPGDEYVDWVGTSSYMNMSASAKNTWASYTDAFYCVGKYANQMAKIKPIIDEFGDRKPIIITECGFCYESADSTQTIEYAAEKLRYFYSYVNMVYPQVKAVFYFNTNFGGNKYMLFNTDKSPACSNSDLYTSLMSQNAGYASLREGSAEGYTRVTTLSEVRDTLDLAVHAAYPGDTSVKVTYSWNGDSIAVCDTVPYNVTVGKDKLTEGEHTLKVTTEAGAMKYEYTYRVVVDADGKVTVSAFPGDADTNGKVNLNDVSLVLKYIAKWNITVDTAAVDVNADGKVNLSDVTLILKYIAKWDVVLN